MRPAAPRVWLYHGFGLRHREGDPHNLFVSDRDLRSQLVLLKARGWCAVDLDGWLAHLGGRNVGRRCFLVTIDDGYVSTLDVAAPILRDLGVPAVLFVPPAHLGATSSWMPAMPNEPLIRPDGLRDLAEFGIEVGSHGHDHARMVGLSRSDLLRNTTHAAECLADLVGYRPRAFAYPEGAHDRAAVSAVRAAGYATAFSIRGVNVDGGRDRRFAAPRVDVNATDTARTFRMKVSPWWPAAAEVGGLTPRLRARAHRLLGSAR